MGDQLCLPALAKVLSGRTAYDERVYRRTQAGTNLHERYVSKRESQDIAAKDLDTRRTESWLHNEFEKINEADRDGRAQREIDRRDRITTLANRLRKRGIAG